MIKIEIKNQTHSIAGKIQLERHAHERKDLKDFQKKTN